MITKEQIEKKITLEKINEIRSLCEKMNLLGEFLLGESWIFLGYEKMFQFAKTIKKSEFEQGQYYAWHILIGSTTTFKQSPKLDFPESYSVRSFFKKQIQLLESKEAVINKVN